MAVIESNPVLYTFCQIQQIPTHGLLAILCVYAEKNPPVLVHSRGSLNGETKKQHCSRRSITESIFQPIAWQGEGEIRVSFFGVITLQGMPTNVVSGASEGTCVFEC